MKARIAFVLPDMSGGGAERVALVLIKAFLNEGHDVDLVLASGRGELLDQVPEGVRVLDLRTSRLRGALLPLVRYLRQSRPDAVHVSMWPLTVLAIVAHRLARSRSRMIVTDHAILSLQYKGNRLRPLAATVRRFYPLATARVAVSSAVAEDLASLSGLPPSTLDVVYNPLPRPQPATADARARADRTWGEGAARILAVGIIKREKNFPLLLEAFANLLQRRAAKLVILGDGPDRDLVEQAIDRLGLRDHVEIAGFQPELGCWYETADLLAVSSDEEGFGNVIVEAMHAGLPVVSTDCGGPREILDEGRYGRLVPVGDAAALAQAMEQVLDSPRDAAALKERAEALSGRTAIERYERLMLG